MVHWPMYSVSSLRLHAILAGSKILTTPMNGPIYRPQVATMRQLTAVIDCL